MAADTAPHHLPAGGHGEAPPPELHRGGTRRGHKRRRRWLAQGGSSQTRPRGGASPSAAGTEAATLTDPQSAAAATDEHRMSPPRRCGTYDGCAGHYGHCGKAANEGWIPNRAACQRQHVQVTGEGGSSADQMDDCRPSQLRWWYPRRMRWPPRPPQGRAAKRSGFPAEQPARGSTHTHGEGGSGVRGRLIAPGEQGRAKHG